RERTERLAEYRTERPPRIARLHGMAGSLARRKQVTHVDALSFGVNLAKHGAAESKRNPATFGRLTVQDDRGLSVACPGDGSGDTSVVGTRTRFQCCVVS